MKLKHYIIGYSIEVLMIVLMLLIADHLNTDNALIGIIQFLLVFICGMIALITCAALEG